VDRTSPVSRWRSRWPAPSVPVVFDGVFNGEQGLPVYVAPPPEALGWSFPPERLQAWIALLGAAIVLLLLANLVHSRFGRAMRAVRDNEVAAQLAGISVARTQVTIFVVSAACAGLGGGLLAILAQSVSPSGYALTLSLYLVLAIVLGGLGSLAGAVWGALILVLLPETITAITDTLPLSAGLAQRLNGNLPLAVFGLTLVVVMIAAPGGIHGLLRRAVSRLRVARKAHSSP
jgi:branched-chain amino acid transport system permease protein